MARVLPTQKPIRFNQSHHEACSLMHCAAVRVSKISNNSWFFLGGTALRWKRECWDMVDLEISWLELRIKHMIFEVSLLFFCRSVRNVCEQETVPIATVLWSSRMLMIIFENPDIFKMKNIQKKIWKMFTIRFATYCIVSPHIKKYLSTCLSPNFVPNWTRTGQCSTGRTSVGLPSDFRRTFWPTDPIGPGRPAIGHSN